MLALESDAAPRHLGGDIHLHLRAVGGMHPAPPFLGGGNDLVGREPQEVAPACGEPHAIVSQVPIEERVLRAAHRQRQPLGARARRARMIARGRGILRLRRREPVPFGGAQPSDETNDHRNGHNQCGRCQQCRCRHSRGDGTGRVCRESLRKPRSIRRRTPHHASRFKSHPTAETKQRPETNRQLPHNDATGHLGMHLAIVLVVARRRERDRVRPTGAQRAARKAW